MSIFPLHCQNYINGQWCDSESLRTFPIYNPADWRQAVHSYPLSTAGETDRAIDFAAEAFDSWKKTPLAQKVAIMRKAETIIQDNRARIAELITKENGKLISESLVEIDSALLELSFQIGEGERQFGRIGQSYKKEILSYSQKEALGVVTAIIPWNFPFNVPLRKLVPALMAGNTAVLKPAGQTSGVGELVMQIFIEAGLPDNVLQFVAGSGSELSSSLVCHPKVKAVTFTGSTIVGQNIAEKAATSFTRTQLEMGGKNPLLVLADADLDAAAEAVVVGAFSCAGQWCTATSRLIVEHSVADELIGKIVALTKAIVPGAGSTVGATMGPVCGAQQLDGILSHIETAINAGATLITGGKCINTGDLKHGCFVEPTIFDHIDPKMKIAQEEVFGPVLSIIRVDDYAQGLAVANDIEYGLSSSIFTQDLDKALHFAEASEVGLTHVNMHSAYKEPQICFGGYKNSGFGLPEAGSAGIQFFQEEKAIYIKKQNL